MKTTKTKSYMSIYWIAIMVTLLALLIIGLILYVRLLAPIRSVDTRISGYHISAARYHDASSFNIFSKRLPVL